MNITAEIFYLRASKPNKTNLAIKIHDKYRMHCIDFLHDHGYTVTPGEDSDFDPAKPFLASLAVVNRFQHIIMNAASAKVFVAEINSVNRKRI